MYVAAARPLALAFACWPPRPLFKGGTNRRDPWGLLAPARGGGPGAPGGACIPGASSGSRLTVVCLLHLTRDKTEAQTNRADCPEPSAARRAGCGAAPGRPRPAGRPRAWGPHVCDRDRGRGSRPRSGRGSPGSSAPPAGRLQASDGGRRTGGVSGTRDRPAPAPFPHPRPRPALCPGGPTWGRQTELGHLCGQVARPLRDWPDQERALESF